MTQTHTPGPWSHANPNVAGNMNVRGDGKDIACVYAPEWGYDAPTNRLESAANARLIAAAPDLLEAGEAVIAAWESGDLAAAVHSLDAAIAKARGQA